MQTGARGPYLGLASTSTLARASSPLRPFPHEDIHWGDLAVPWL